MNDLNKTGNSENTTVNKRRSFLKKAGVTSLVLTLPSQSVWGTACTVSGNMSGNLSNPNQTGCVLKGRSPGYWHGHLGGYSALVWDDVFSGRPPFGTNTTTGAAIPVTTPIEDFLPKRKGGSKNPIRGPHNLNRHLLAAFLNADSGLYPLAGVTSYEYVAALYDEIDTLGASSSGAKDIKEAIEGTY